MSSNPSKLSGREPSLGGEPSPRTGDEPSLPADFVVLKALLADDVASIPVYGGMNRIQRMQTIRQRGKAALPALLELCHHADGHVRGTAATVLGWIGDPKAIPTLVNVLQIAAAERHGYGLVRAAAVALRNIGIESEEALLSLLDHSEAIVRENAIEALGFIRSRKSAPRLAGMLTEDTLDDFRQVISTALRRIGDPAVLPVLESAISSSDKYGDYHIVWAIDELSGLEAPDILLRIYAKAGPHARPCCLIFLSRRQDTRALELMELSLKSGYAWERITALRCYLQYGSPEFIPLIEPLLHDDSDDNRREAARVIQALQRSGQS